MWAPTGPLYGKGAVFLNGCAEAILDFQTPEEMPSKEVFTRKDMEAGRRWLVIRPLDGGVIPVDCLEVF